MPKSRGEFGPSVTLLGRSALRDTPDSWNDPACWTSPPPVPRRPISVLLLLPHTLSAAPADSGMSLPGSDAAVGLADGNMCAASGDAAEGGAAGDADGGGHVLPRRTVARTKDVPLRSAASAAGVVRGDARACAAASGDADGEELCRNENFLESVLEPSFRPDHPRCGAVSLSL